VAKRSIAESSTARDATNRSLTFGMAASEIYVLIGWTTLEESCSCLNT